MEITPIKQGRLLANDISKGFTLVELLVSIVIIGVLSAMALPSFLSQAAKARANEAKSAVGTVNRAQIAYRLENNTMAASITDLDAKISGKFYSYSIVNSSQNFAAVTASTGQADLKGYSGAIALELSMTDEVFRQVLCQTIQNVNANISAMPPIISNNPTCQSDAQPIE